MDQPIRVLVVDDSPLMRHRLGVIIGSASGFELAGVSTNGTECIRCLPTVRPDVITLDVEMPGLSGLATLQEIMRVRPTPVLMVSSLTEAGAQTTFEALALGAADYLAKPSHTAMNGSTTFRGELLAKLRIAARVRVSQLARLAGARTLNAQRLAENRRAATAVLQRLSAAESSPSLGTSHTCAIDRAALHDAQRPTEPRTPEGRVQVISTAEPLARKPSLFTPRGQGANLVVVGSSTGGPQALDQVFGNLAEDLTATFLIIQHMPPLFTRSLAARLARRSGLPTREAEEGDQLMSGEVLVAPGGSHLVVGPDRRLHLEHSEPLHGVRPAIDRTLFTLADHWRGSCLVVILTGMGVDGAAGAGALRAHGAQVIAQDEQTSIVFGMPRAVIEAGQASSVLPLEQIGPAIVQWTRTATVPSASPV